MITTICIMYLIVLLFMIYYEIRDQWVYKFRLSIIKNDFSRYFMIPSYHRMLLRYSFVWKTDVRYWVTVYEIEILKRRLKENDFI